MVEQIKALCLKNNTSIKALEKELGFGNGSIRRWDTHKPSIERVNMVAEHFHVPVSVITGTTDINDIDSKETPANQDITFDDFTYALHNETKELSEEKKQQLLEMARFFKQQQDKKKEK